MLTTLHAVGLQIIQEFERQDWSALIVLAFALSILSHRFCPDFGGSQYKFRADAGRVAAVLLIPYLVFLYPRFTFGNFEMLVVSLIQLALFYFILYGASLLVVPRLWLLHSWVHDARRGFVKSWNDNVEAMQKRNDIRREERWLRDNPPAAPIPRAQLLEQQMTEAQDDYEYEARLIERSRVLNKDEKRVALGQLKQRLIKRIDGIIK